MKEKKITTADGDVYYWISENWDNKIRTIFFFPGLTADHTMFAAQFAYFEGKYNIIAWDPPCHGRSRQFSTFSFESTSNAVLQIMNQHDVADIITVGQSLGGYYIQALILRHPDKVKAFIGIGTTPYGDKYYSKADKFWLRQVGWMSKCYPLSQLKKAVSKQATFTDRGYQNMMDMISPYKKNEFCHLMQIAYTAFLRDNRDIEIKCPVLITHGEFDKVGKVQQYCKKWQEETGFPFMIVKDAGHNANVDNPEESNRIIESFLRESDLV